MASNIFEMKQSENYSFEKLLNEPKVLFEKLDELCISGDNQESIKQIIIDLNKNHSADICKIAIEAINAESVFDIIEIIKDAFPYLNHNTSTLIQFLKTSFNSIGTNFCDYVQYDLIKELAREQPELVKELGNKLLKINEPFIVNYISIIYEFFSIYEIEKVHSYLINQTECKDESIIQAIICSLSKLDYWENKKELLAEETLNIFEKLLKENSTSINSSIAWGLNQFICKIDRAKDILLALIEKKDDNVSFQIAKLLFINFEVLVEKDWFEYVIYKFTKTNLEQSGTIGQIDLILSKYSKRNLNTKFAENFILEWILSSNYITNPIDLNSIWSTTLRDIYKNEIALSRFTTNLFNSDDIQCHIAISKTIEHSKSGFHGSFKFDSNIINELDFTSILFICRKVLGYLIIPDIIYSLLDSIAQNYKNNPKVIDLICEIYIEYLSKDYSTTTIKHLEKTIREIEPCLLKAKLKISYRVIKDRLELLISLPRLKELGTSTRNLYQISLEESKKHNKLLKKTKGKSVLSLIANNIPLKYGNGWFHYYNGEYSDISKLTTFSSSMEIPKKEITQPISSSIERINFKLVKRIEL